MRIRPPAVAGAFYPADPATLEAMVERMLAGASASVGEEEGPPKAVIVPHAGYVYSGPIAASAYGELARLRGRVRRVVLLGPAHRVAFRGLAAPEAEAFQTPLGRIPIDHDALETLRELPQVLWSDRAHATEHSLEVQLPFLQRVLGDFVLVPLVVGDASDEAVAEVIDRLWGGEETLFVISSDLSHYHDYATARRLDAGTCAAIEALAPESLGDESACGRVPVRGMLRAARRHHLAVRTLDLRSSGDTAGDRDRVVGYGAWTLTPGPVREARGRDEDATTGDDAALLDLARRAIGIETGRPAAIDLARVPSQWREPGACFVTLRSPSGELRGCIGSLEATRPLVEDVVANAVAAATRDPRMIPVSAPELETLRIELSILSPLEALHARSAEDLARQLRPGHDGLVLQDGEARGTLLPQVWSQIRSPAEFVGSVWRKAGLPPGHWSSGVQAWRYFVRKIA